MRASNEFSGPLPNSRFGQAGVRAVRKRCGGSSNQEDRGSDVPADATASAKRQLRGRIETASLRRWWKVHKRNYPWRSSKNPFHILCAEFMLRRTRADQVVPVYLNVTGRYSSPQDVISEPEVQTLAVLAPLGLHWRIHQFRSLCSTLVEDYDGRVPTAFQDLIQLPGVGPYVAAAVRIFAFGQSEPLIDTNILRVFSRYFGVPLPDSRRRATGTLKAVAGIVPRRNVRSFWWALLDLASGVCTHRSPAHDLCPLASTCRDALSQIDSSPRTGLSRDRRGCEMEGGRNE
jgi:A/G-specific adenine glycosylase